MSRLPKPVRQLAAVALLVAALIGAYAAAVEPLWRHFADSRQRIAEGRVVLGRLVAAAGRGAEAEAIERAAASAPLAGLLLKGDTEAIQLAGLQSIVGEAASKRGLRITSARPLPALTVNGQRLLGVRFDVRGDLATLQQLLHGVESGSPLLFVHGVQLRRTGGAPIQEGGLSLDASISVYGVQPMSKGDRT